MAWDGVLGAHAGAAIKEAFYKDKTVEHKGVLRNSTVFTKVSMGAINLQFSMLLARRC
jgi:hypothetical protein